MPSRRIALLNAASPEHQYSTSRNFRACLPNCTLHEYNTQNGELPTNRNYDGYIITGSKASVTDDTDWITDLKQFTTDTITENTPIFGICFGHQLLADVLGGTVEYMGEYEIGYHPITKTTNSPLLTGVDNPFYSFITHQDVVTELPADAIQIAATDYGIHGFEHKNVYGLQSHPEFTINTAQQVIAEKNLDPDTKAQARETITIDTVTAAQHTRLIFDNFLYSIVRPALLST